MDARVLSSPARFTVCSHSQPTPRDNLPHRRLPCPTPLPTRPGHGHRNPSSIPSLTVPQLFCTMPPDPSISPTAPSLAGGSQFPGTFTVSVDPNNPFERRSSDLLTAPGHAGTASTARTGFLSLPIELRFMIYKHYANRVKRHRGRGVDRRLSNRICGVPLHFPPMCQLNKQIRAEFFQEYLPIIPWSVEKSLEGLAAFRSWVKLLGSHARHLRRFRLTCGRGCAFVVSLVPGEQCGYYHHCEYLSLLLEDPDGHFDYLDPDWVAPYIEKQVVAPLVKRIEHGTLRGKDVVAALDWIFVDAPILFDFCWYDLEDSVIL